MDRLVGVAGYFSFRAPSSMMEPVLLLEAAENGWWYTAPLPEGKLIAVFLTDADFIQREKLTQPDRWKAQLALTDEQSRRIQKHGLSLDGEIRIVQAESSFLDRIAGDGWLAAGDAAASFDPLSAEGITSAINSGLDAADAAAAWLDGDENALVTYADCVRRSYAEYLTHRSVYYQIERRWLNGDFWKTRHALPSVFSARGTSACA
jgi:flavin-dependent dehydrogenase